MTSPASKPSVESLAAGRTIADRYSVLSVLGQGGMGQVVLVEHLALGRRFALKVLRLEKWNEELVRRFHREARALAKVTTARVAQVTDFGVDPEVGPFYVMELLDGETLEDRLEKRGPLTPRDAARVCAELCDALVDVHENGIVHRDLKPSNVGLTANGPVGVKLLDFGLAASMDDAFLSKITQSQQILGSLPYMAPEQFNGVAPAPSMDLYAVGVVLYESLTGRLPFMAPSTAALIHQILAMPPPALPRELSGGIHLDAIIDRLMAKEPERRFASAKAAAQALREVVHLLGGPHPRTREVDEVSGSIPIETQASSPSFGLQPTLQAGAYRPPVESGPRMVGYGSVPGSGPFGTAPVTPGPVSFGHIAHEPVLARPTNMGAKLVVVFALGMVLAGVAAGAVVGVLTAIDSGRDEEPEETVFDPPDDPGPSVISNQAQEEIGLDPPALNPAAALPSALDTVEPEPEPPAPEVAPPPPAPPAAPLRREPRNVYRPPQPRPLEPTVRPLPPPPPTNTQGSWNGNTIDRW